MSAEIVKEFITEEGYKALVRHIKTDFPTDFTPDFSIQTEWYCGYVGIPTNHPFFEKNYDEIDISVHGGLTFSDYMDGIWFIGFDCAHVGDNIKIQDIDYVTKEIENMSKQIKDAE